jgi:acetyl-CoA acetyltransferase
VEETGRRLTPRVCEDGLYQVLKREPQRDDFWDLRPQDLVAAVVRTLLERTGVRTDAMEDLLTGTALRWEINETFAVVTLYAMKELEPDPEAVNTGGGARIIGALARQMQINGVDYGVATLCVGGGQGAAVVLKRV